MYSSRVLGFAFRAQVRSEARQKFGKSALGSELLRLGTKPECPLDLTLWLHDRSRIGIVDRSGLVFWAAAPPGASFLGASGVRPVADVARASRPLWRGHPARAGWTLARPGGYSLLGGSVGSGPAGARRSRHSGRDARATLGDPMESGNLQFFSKKQTHQVIANIRSCPKIGQIKPDSGIDGLRGADLSGR